MLLSLCNGAAFSLVHFILHLAGFVVSKARTGRNQAADDDVFLQAAQFVTLAHDGRLSQHARGFLEGRGGDEAVGRQRRLGDTQQQVGVGSRDFSLGQQGIVGVVDLAAFDLFAGNVAGIARVFDHNTAQHLAHDHFDVLVVDLHALQTVHVLHLVDDVACQLLNAQQAQDVLRIGRTIDDAFALVDHLALVHQNVLFLGNEFFPHLAVRIGDLQADLALGLLTERNGAGELGQHALVLG